MNISDLSKPLPIEDVEFRIQSINKGGYATILAFKNARVDINRLNAVCGPLGWQRRHTRDNKNCIVSIWDDANKHWVDKEDTGTESSAEKEKGLASDSFKRTCFNLGIGIELYEYPVIQIKLNSSEVDLTAQPRPKATWDLKLKEWEWWNQFIDGKIVRLAAKDQNGNKRFDWSDNKAIQRALELAIENHKETIECVKYNLEEGILSTAAEAWFELTHEEQRSIWAAPSNGGPFTTKERETIKSSEFRLAYFGDK